MRVAFGLWTHDRKSSIALSDFFAALVRLVTLNPESAFQIIMHPKRQQCVVRR